ncbi:MAG: prepilin-type N-terminal cleavage/methylation domain-containing protein [Candidatus Omnitrophota bacterium]
MRKRVSAGFTLIELIISVALLAILVAAAIVAFQNITQKAQIAQLKATLKSVRSAILIQKANNELNNSRGDGYHPRINFWPTFEEVRRGSYDAQLSESILSVVLSGNPFITDPRTPPFDNEFVADTSTSVFYNNPDAAGKTNIANNLVVCAPQGTIKGTLCPADPCGAGWVYNPYTGEFWANSNQFGENAW